MTGYEILALALGEPVGNLTSVLDAVADGASDLAPLANTLRTKLGNEVSGVNLTDVGAAIAPELTDIARGKFNPRRHPSDGA